MTLIDLDDIISSNQMADLVGAAPPVISMT